MCLQSRDRKGKKHLLYCSSLPWNKIFFSKIFHFAISTFVPFARILTSFFSCLDLPNAFLARSGFVGWLDPEPPLSRARAARSLSPPKREVPRPPPPRRAPEEGEGGRDRKIGENRFRNLRKKTVSLYIFFKVEKWFKKGASQCLWFLRPFPCHRKQLISHTH